MATVKNKKDELIQELWDTVQVKRKEIDKIDKPVWKTNCSFPWDVNSPNNRLNIQVATDVNLFVSALSLILEKTYFHKKANELLGIDSKFIWSGYSLEDWQSDFKSRIDKIQITKKKEDLNRMEARLNDMISPERKEELELEQIRKDLMAS